MVISSKVINFILIALVCILWWPTRHLPAFWDSSGYAMPTANYIYTHNFQLPPQGFVSIHPPLYMYLVASSWILFGQSLLVTHLLNLIFTLILVLATYHLGQHLFGKQVALITILLVLVTPEIVGQIGALYVDLPVAAFSLLGLLFTFKHRWLLASLSLTAAILTKTTAAPFVAVFFLYYLHQKPLMSITKAVHFSFPVIGFAIWSYVNKITYGAWFINDRLSQYISDQWQASHILKNAISPLVGVFDWQSRELISILLVWSILTLIIKKSPVKKRKPLIYLSLIIVFTSAFFAFAGLFHIKYLLAPTVVLYLIVIHITSTALNSLAKPSTYKIAVLASTCIVAVFIYRNLASWRPPGPPSGAIFSNQEHSITYQDMQKNWRAAATYLQHYHPQAAIFGGFPEVYELQYPYLGYVTQPLNVQLCRHANPSLYSTAIVYHHLYSPEISACQDLIKQYSSRKLIRFHTNGWFIELHQVDFSSPLPLG